MINNNPFRVGRGLVAILKEGMHSVSIINFKDIINRFDNKNKYDKA